MWSASALDDFRSRKYLEDGVSRKQGKGASRSPEKGTSGLRSAAFVGLGQMGRALAPHLSGSGLELTCVDPDEGVGREVQAAGLTWAPRLRDLGSVDVVFLCVPGPVEVTEVLAELGKLERAPTFLVNLSTIGPDATVGVCASFRKFAPHGVYVESPISGGVLRAADRECALLWAAEPAEGRAEIEPLLEHLSRCLIAFQTVAEAATAKLANNLAMLATSFGALEAMEWATRRGVALDDLFDALRAGTADSYPLRSTLARSVQEGDYERGFAMRLALKDVRLILDGTDPPRSKMPLAHEIGRQLQAGCEAGLGEMTFPAVVAGRGIRGASALSGKAGDELRDTGGALR